MEVTWLGHSCFRLRSDQLVLIADPYADSLGLSMGGPSAQAVTMSHHHPHHSHEEGLAGDFRVFRGPGEYEYLGILMRGVMTAPGDGDPPDKRNTAYHIEMEGLRLCHLGDVSSGLSVRNIDELSPVDVLFLPVGGVCTIGLSQALEIVRALGPKVIVPMHYRLPGLTVELGDLDAFLREMGIKEVEPQARLNVTTTNLPAEMRVVVLNAQGTV